MENQEKIDDIIAMLDHFVQTGGGHMNIQVEDPNQIETIHVDTYKSNDCSLGNMACKVPTLMESVDEQSE